MPLQSPRADDLRVIRSLCQFMSRQRDGCATVQDVSDFLSKIGNRANGHEWKRSRIYHYTSAACELKLAEKASFHTFALTSLGYQLANIHPEAQLETPLSQNEKILISTLLISSKIVADYLALYMPTGRPPKTVTEFIQRGKPIRIVRSDNGQFVLTSASSKCITLDKSQKRSLAWTLFNWLRALDLADHVYKEDVDSFLFWEREEVRVFYPIRKRSVTPQVIKKMILDRTEAHDNDICLLYIPDLLVNLCANEGIPKGEFLNTLVRLYQHEPSSFHLEIMSSLRSDNRCKAHYGYLNFPVVNGIMRSHVCVTNQKGARR